VHLVAAVGAIGLIASWPLIQPFLSGVKQEREQAQAETRARINEYIALREEIGMSSPTPPRELTQKQEAEARRLGGGNAMEAAVSALTPSHMEVETNHRGIERCQEAVRNLGRDKNIRVLVNGKSAHRNEVWKLCGRGINHVRAVIG